LDKPLLQPLLRCNLRIGEWRLYFFWSTLAKILLARCYSRGRRLEQQYLSPSKQKFHAQLREAASGGVNDLPKRLASDVSIDSLRPEEFRVIKHIEGFEPYLQRLRFGQTQQILEECHAQISHSWTGEEAPAGGSRRAQRVLAKGNRIAIGLPVSRVVVEVEWTTGVIRFVSTVVVDAVSRA